MADLPKGPFKRQSGPHYTDLRTGELVRPLAFMHYCEHPGCKEWGSFGFGVRLTAKKPMPGRWYCRAHKDDGVKGISTSEGQDAGNPEGANEPEAAGNRPDDLFNHQPDR